MDAKCYLSWLVQSTPEPVIEWIGEAAVTRALQDDLRSTLEFRTDLKSAERYAQQCPVPGASAADYCLRETEPLPSASVLAGIHFFGQDVSRPYVGVYAQSRDLTLEETVEATHNLLDEFQLFGADAVWWWRAVDAEDLAAVPGAWADQRLLMGRIDEIRQRPLPDSPLEFSLRPDDEGAYYDAYSRTFAAFLAENPVWRGRLHETDRSLYAQCAQAGTLCVVLAGGRFAGVIAARPGTVRGIPGWEIVEEILHEDFRGRGLAARMQRLFLEQLDSTARPLVLGTIDYANGPSRSTALRVGRKDVGGWVFVGRDTLAASHPSTGARPVGVQRSGTAPRHPPSARISGD